MDRILETGNCGNPRNSTTTIISQSPTYLQKPYTVHEKLGEKRDRSRCILNQMAGDEWAGTASRQIGSCSEQIDCAIGQRVVEAAAGWRVDRAGHIPAQDDPLASAVFFGARDSARPKAGTGCRGAEDFHTAGCVPASSASTPRYITATRSQICRTMLRSWAMNR